MQKMNSNELLKERQKEAIRKKEAYHKLTEIKMKVLVIVCKKLKLDNNGRLSHKTNQTVNHIGDNNNDDKKRKISILNKNEKY